MLSTKTFVIWMGGKQKIIAVNGMCFYVLKACKTQNNIYITRCFILRDGTLGFTCGTLHNLVLINVELYLLFLSY